MRKILLGLVLSFLLFVVGSSGGNTKDPKYLKLIENCADKLSEPARREEVRDYRKLLNGLTGGESPEFKKQYKQRIKTIENLLKLSFSEKRTYLVYQPALFQCEKNWERDPVAFKSRWE
jgi:ADP-heptose:LPS heptosyltransferase